MKLRAMVASAALAATTIIGVPVAAPALSNAGVDTPGVTAEAASIGWGPTCRTMRTKYYSAPGITVYKNNTYKWWTTSLQGTRCIFHSTHYTVVKWRA